MLLIKQHIKSIPFFSFIKHSSDYSRHINCLRPLKHWDRGFESHSKNGYLCGCIPCSSVCSYNPCDGLTLRPGSITDCVQDQET